MLPPKFFYVIHQPLDSRSILAVLPLVVIAYASHLVIQPHLKLSVPVQNISKDGTHSTADAYIRFHRPCHACPQHVSSEPILIAGALDDLAEAQSVPKGTAFNQLLVRNLFIFVRQAHCEAKVKLWIWVEASSAQLDDVSDAFGWAVFASYSVWLVEGPDEGQCEVDFAGCTFHGGYDEASEAVWRV